MKRNPVDSDNPARWAESGWNEVERKGGGNPDHEKKKSKPEANANVEKKFQNRHRRLYGNDCGIVWQNF